MTRRIALVVLALAAAVYPARAQRHPMTVRDFLSV